jgi:hypothetical protein
VILGSGVLEYPTPHLEITITIQSNDLTHHQSYTKKQQVMYELIRMLHEDKGLGYRKISKKLNSWGIKTQRGKEWFNTSVSSVLKRKHQRDVRIEEVRKQEYQIQMDKLKLKYIKSD